MSRVLAAWIRALEQTKAAKDSCVTLPGLMAGLASVHGDRPALCDDAETLCYRGLSQRALAVGSWAASHRLTPGRTVCLLMPNSADYVAVWIGLSGAGCVVALLNTNVRGEALLHCIVAAGASAVIVAQDLVAILQPLASRLPAGLGVWVHGGDGEPWPAFKPDGEDMLPDHTPAPSDRALLIFTSGTTGLPKATIVTHARVVEWSYWFAGLMDASPSDRLYDCLPLYHSVGGIIAVGSMLVAGGSVLIRARFSAGRFWQDVAGHGCTIVQYIGELFRYLLNTPPHPAERTHTLRLACGNGLAGDIWEPAQQRFALPQILEFYAATEGGVSLYNVEGKPGAIGRFPPILRHRLGISLIRTDPDTGEPLRDAGGHCITCADDEAGEAIGRLSQDGRRFDGYTDAAASAAKLIRNVLAPGDVWFRTGDLLRRDSGGYYSFVDRIGDSYRWQGENVSATEVTLVVRTCRGVTDAAVYGVRVPGHDGKAGMAALTVAAGFDWSQFHDHIARALPVYAQPLFVRIKGALDITATFKLVKSALASEGFAGSTDPIWVRQSLGFVPLGAELAGRIATGAWRP